MQATEVAPAAAPEDVEEAEVAALKEMMKRDSGPRKKSPRARSQHQAERRRDSSQRQLPQRHAQTSREPPPSWNSAPFRPRPPALHGLKTDSEPWAMDEALYEHGMFKHGARPRLTSERQHRSRDDMEREYYELVNKWHRERAWDDSPYRAAPAPIRGLRSNAGAQTRQSSLQSLLLFPRPCPDLSWFEPRCAKVL